MWGPHRLEGFGDSRSELVGGFLRQPLTDCDTQRKSPTSRHSPHGCSLALPRTRERRVSIRARRGPYASSFPLSLSLFYTAPRPTAAATPDSPPCLSANSNNGLNRSEAAARREPGAETIDETLSHAPPQQHTDFPFFCVSPCQRRQPLPPPSFSRGGRGPRSPREPCTTDANPPIAHARSHGGETTLTSLFR
jgi:hypothetical protein